MKRHKIQTITKIKYLLLFIASIAFIVYGNSNDIAIEMPDEIADEIIADWEDYDSIVDDYTSAIQKIVENLPSVYQQKVIPGFKKESYYSACHWRRVSRFQDQDENVQEKIKKVLFARHHDLGGEIIGFLEEMNPDGFVTNMGRWGGTSCQSKSTKYKPGSGLCIANFDNYYPKFDYLLKDDNGVIRDPCISFDAQKVLFAWSKDNNGYHLWEIDVNNPQNIKQLTSDPDGLVVSDYEPCYLQNDDIIFNSSRCYGFVECNTNMTSNLFIMNKNGKYLRRIGYDQVHTFHPVLMENGKVLYSRWEYNDRNVSNCCGLFTMNIDGTQQNEHFGNQTEWPATFIHARQIPGTRKIISVISGFQAPYAGDLVIIDPNTSRNGMSAIELIAPKRPNPEIPFVSFGGNIENYNFQNPYPIDDRWFLISWRKNEKDKFKIYYMNVDGERELIAWDKNQSLSQPMPLTSRNIPKTPAYMADYTKNDAFLSVQDVYHGTGTGETVPKGSVKKIRLIALEYRTDPAFGNTGAQGYQMTPVGRWTSSWEAKRIIGEIKVEENGSASFKVPPRTPLFIQLIDEKGRMVQTMRSWMTLQPGETFSCFGCHEDKNEAPSLAEPLANAKQKDLNRFYDVDATGYFSYPVHIQPILDKNCVRGGCHDDSHKLLDLRGDKIWTGTLDVDNRNACRFWNRSYINLTDLSKDYLSFIDVNTTATGLRPNSIGSQKSKLMNMLLDGHHETALTAEEFEKIATWIDLCIPHSGTYSDDMRENDAIKYQMRLERRKKHEELEEKNIEEFIADGGYKTYTYGSEVKNPDPRHGNMPIISSPFLKGDRFSVIFCGKSKRITFHLPSEGDITIVDLKGRQLGKIEITPGGYLKSSIHSTELDLPSGVYMTKFRGKSFSENRMVSILRR